MLIRVKCKLCNDIIDSKSVRAPTTCSCGEISVDLDHGYLHANVKNLGNLVGMDDEGNEIVVKYKETPEPTPDEIRHQKAQELWSHPSMDLVKNSKLEAQSAKPPENDVLYMLDEMIQRIENLPEEARYAPITHADYLSILYIIKAIIR